MKRILTGVGIILSAAALLAAQGPVAPGTQQVSEEAVIRMCGSRMSLMFSQFGPPTDVWAERGSSPREDKVFFDYGAFGFTIREKTIRTCFLFKEWTAPIRGLRIGDDPEKVRQVLGDPPTVIKDEEGRVTAFGYELKDLDAELFTNFSKDGRLWRVEVSLK